MTNGEILIERLKQLDAQLLSPLDLSFASFVCRVAGENDHYPLFLAAALAADASVKRKHTCLDLKEFNGSLDGYFKDTDDGEIPANETAEFLRMLPIPDYWTEQLLACKPAVAIAADGRTSPAPLILDGTRLYIYRDWLCEQDLALDFRQRCAARTVLRASVTGREITAVSSYFHPMTGKIDRQQLAVFAALRQNFTVISGGPGTGKTTVAAALCTRLLETDPKVKITLCASTGKAQARLQEALLEQIPRLNCTAATKDQLRKLPVATIHRLLGSRPGTPRFRYNRNHQLATEVLIVDEASMISQSLMKALLEATPLTTALIMLGDMQQLASVEAGMVLRDFCLAAGGNHFDREFVRDFAAAFPAAAELSAAGDGDIFSNKVIELEENHRFAAERGLGLTVTAFRRLPDHPSPAAVQEIVDAMHNDPSGEITVQMPPSWTSSGFARHLASHLNQTRVDFEGKKRRYLDFRNERSVERAYELYNKFRILCVHRSGRYGAEMINRLIEQQLLPPPEGRRQVFYPGKPIIINENNYAMELFNGDTGIIWPDEHGGLKAFFPGGGAEKREFRSFVPHLLPDFSAAYALTVHKAQGSGFQQVLIITPAELSPLLTREMIYTALSRAEQRAVFWTRSELLAAALQNTVRRHSSLRRCLSKK
ncbi:MAG: exodeoxyribonuclease V subunit alpha [Victivallaceae bacterium]|nr:exodeoxyribonuclease V subunit alpha [Victivallaceae bacterium]